MPLSEKSVRAMLPLDKRFRQSDSGGLFIEVAPSGAKTWKVAYRFEGGQRSAVIAINCCPALQRPLALNPPR